MIIKKSGYEASQSLSKIELIPSKTPFSAKRAGLSNGVYCYAILFKDGQDKSFFVCCCAYVRVFHNSVASICSEKNCRKFFPRTLPVPRSEQFSESEVQGKLIARRN